MITKWLCVFCGGGLGSLTRYLVSRIFVQRLPNLWFPLPTFVINVTGSMAIGFLMTLGAERLRWHSNWLLLAVTGFLGGYTTFSTFEYDAYLGFRSGRSAASLLYLAGSVGLGLAGVWLGSMLATAVAPKR